MSKKLRKGGVDFTLNSFPHSETHLNLKNENKVGHCANQYTKEIDTKQREQ